jgi:hypothetical protein
MLDDLVSDMAHRELAFRGLAGLTESKRAGYSTTKWAASQPVAIRLVSRLRSS